MRDIVSIMGENKMDDLSEVGDCKQVHSQTRAHCARDLLMELVIPARQEETTQQKTAALLATMKLSCFIELHVPKDYPLARRSIQAKAMNHFRCF